MHTEKKLQSALILSSLILANLGCGGGSNNSGAGNQCKTLCTLLGTDLRVVGESERCDPINSPIVQLQIKDQSADTASICTGTLITPDSVLTAGHCVPLDAQGLNVLVNGKLIPASQALVHPQYRVDFNAEAVFFDVAIVKLSVPQNESVTLPINLNTEPLKGENILFGYGIDNTGKVGSLRGGEIIVNQVTTNHLVSFYDGSKANSCDGDSGGPLLLTNSCEDPKKIQTGIVGIVSSGRDTKCRSGDRALYTNLQEPTTVAFINKNAPGTVFLR